MRISSTIGCVLTAVLFAGSASAANVVQSFAATSAVGSGADHSLWIQPGLGSNNGISIGRDFDFMPAGTLTLFDDGSMTLTGSTKTQSAGVNAGFYVNFSYDDVFVKTSGPDAGDPFEPIFKSENNSKEVLGETFYKNLTTGTLTGTGLLEGLVLTIERKPVNGPYATQIGPSNGLNNGANNKNYGMANWFMISEISNNCFSVFCEGKSFDFLLGKQGDINIDLEPVPLPAGGLLLISGMAGLAMARRRCKS